MTPAQIRKALLGEAATGVIPRDLLTTHRILERWSVDSGSGLPSDFWQDDTPKSRMVSLDPDTWLIVDKQVRIAPKLTNRIVVTWFCRPTPVREKFRELGYTREKGYIALSLALNYMRARFQDNANGTLRELLLLRV